LGICLNLIVNVKDLGIKKQGVERWSNGMLDEWRNVNKNNAAGEWPPAVQKRWRV